MSRASSRAWVQYNVKPVPELPTQFELRVKRLGLAESPEKWPHSPSLRSWVKRHKNRCYIPEDLIMQLGLAGRYEYENGYE